MIGRRRLAMAAAGLLTGAAGQGPIKVPPVTLRDHEGHPWPLRDLVSAQPVALGFFFVRCTTVCPPQTAAMQVLQAELAGRHVSPAPPLLLSIALDPLGDTPEAITSYAGQFGIRLGRPEGWLMLTGNYDELGRIWSVFGTSGGARDNHPAVLWLRSPSGGWTQVSALADPARLADALVGAS